MKTILSAILGLLCITLVSCQPSLLKDAKVENTQVITPFQQSMLDEINLARTNPAAYAELRLKDAMNNASDNGSYTYLKGLNPLSALTFNNSLNISASNYASFLAEKNLMGHDLNGTPMKRAVTVGFEGSSIGENIAASSSEMYNSIADPKGAAIDFIRLMIIDTGVADLGHRMTMLSSNYSTVGIGYSRNVASAFVNYNVQDYGNL